MIANALFCHRCGNKVEPDDENCQDGRFVSPGKVLQNRYCIDRMVGSGGWGAVYRASYISPELSRIFGNYCAIKEMRPSPDIPADRIMTMFEQEAQSLVRLKHEHIPRITDYFQEAGIYYLVMEYIEGKDLENLMKDNGGRPFPEEKVLQWGIEVCQVLDYLHTRKPKPYIFRDIKPSNIILSNTGKITVVDFGIARIFTRNNGKNLKTGTPGYCPPEQYYGNEDPRADIYALGVTLHYLLSGRDPVMENPCSCQDIPLRTLNPLVSEELASIINKAVQNNLNNRYKSSAEMLEAMTTLFWKSIYPGEKESFQWLGSSLPAVTPLPPALTKKLKIEEVLTSEAKRSPEGAIKKDIFFADVNRNLFQDFLSDKLADIEWFNLRMKAEKLSLTAGFNNLISLSSIPVVPYNHQKKAALDALRIMRGRVLLADEVGLGKTIEAGLIMKELKIRGLIKKILILVPASLTTQWAEELKLHFNEDFTLQKSESDWLEYEQLIASTDTARRENHGEIISQIKYDLLIIDEAHKLKNRSSKAWKLVNRITKRYILMLSATPIQNDLEELFNLITLLKPGQLRGLKEFRKKFIDSSDRRIPVNAEELRVLLYDVMIRNRRSSVDVYLPSRRAGIYYLRESYVEIKFRNEVTDFLRYYYKKNIENPSVALKIIQLQKALGSSSFSALDSLTKWREKTDKSLPDYELLCNLCSLGERVPENRKATALLEILERTSDKVIVFTEFLATQNYLKNLLTQKGYKVSSFNGQMSIKEKDKELDYFRKDGQVLISTQSGSEGKNLQFCHIMVNYDLPWNPMKLEQRIGRLHRLTQEREVLVFNLCLIGTFEGYILYLLSEKIKMFELVIGELDLILGDFERDENFEGTLQKIWLDSLNDEQIKTEIEQFGDKLVIAREKFRESLVADMAVSSLFD